MSIFKRKPKKEEAKETWTATQAEESSEPIVAEEVPEEEWVWVEGYKGTDANMCCRDYQYEIGKQYDMPEDAEIKECESGFHLCRDLSDVFQYYFIRDCNRFFKVKALVRKEDFEKYRSGHLYSMSWSGSSYTFGDAHNKLVAKSIIFVSELSRDEILKDTDVEKLSDKYKDIAIKKGVSKALEEYKNDTLIQDGYSATFAVSIVKSGLFEIAHAVGSQSDLSMDMKVLWILRSQGE